MCVGRETEDSQGGGAMLVFVCDPFIDFQSRSRHAAAIAGLTSSFPPLFFTVILVSCAGTLQQTQRGTAQLRKHADQERLLGTERRALELLGVARPCKAAVCRSRATGCAPLCPVFSNPTQTLFFAAGTLNVVYWLATAQRGAAFSSK